MYVRGGAEYKRIAEQESEVYDKIELDVMRRRGLISLTVSMVGDPVTAIYRDVLSEIKYTRSVEKRYYLLLINIPEAIGYEIPIAGYFLCCNRSRCAI